MEKIEFENIRFCFPKLFIDFFDKPDFFAERFPNNKIFDNGEKFLEIRAKNYNKRSSLILFLTESFGTIPFGTAQKENLSKLNADNTLVVVTGQQPGFLGGPLFTLYKSLSAISLCRKLAEKYENFNFVPVFWVEDNDHDSYEVARSWSFDSNYNLHLFSCCPECTKTDRISISERTFDEQIVTVLELLLTISNDFNSNPEIKSLLQDNYKANNNWATPFINLMNYLLGEFGILFVRSSVARKLGFFAEIVSKEINYFGYSNSIIDTANSLIDAFGYPIQAKNSVVNLFLHNNQYRNKIEWDSKKECYKVGNEYFAEQEIKRLAEQSPEKFSPNVLLRPVCQDYILPTIATVVGPSELGYYTQLKELFEWFEVPLPAVVPRHSLTLVPNILLSKLSEKIEIEKIFQPENDFKEFVYKNEQDQSNSKKIDEIIENLKEKYQDLAKIGSEYEPNLSVSAEAHWQKIAKVLDSYKKKISSAERTHILRKHPDLLKLNRIVLPKNTLQERLICSLYPFAIAERKTFLQKIEEIFYFPNNKHYIVSI